MVIRLWDELCLFVSMVFLSLIAGLMVLEVLSKEALQTVKFWGWVVTCALAAILLYCSGCVTAPNSNQSITINLLSSHSRYGQAIGGTNTTIKGQIEDGGALTATVPIKP